MQKESALIRLCKPISRKNWNAEMFEISFKVAMLHHSVDNFAILIERQDMYREAAHIPDMISVEHAGSVSVPLHKCAYSSRIQWRRNVGWLGNTNNSLMI